MVVLAKFQYGGREGAAAGIQAAKDLRKAKDCVDRRFAVTALGTLGHEGAQYLDALVAALEDEDSGVRYWAAIALGGVGPAAAPHAATLAKALADGDPGVRHWAAVALGNLGPAAAAHAMALENALGDSDPHTRVAATRAIASVAPAAVERVAARLADGLKDEEELFRACSIEALALLGDAAMPHLRGIQDALSDDCSIVRVAAACTLRGLGPAAAQAAAPILAARARADPDADVRARASETLKLVDPVAALGSEDAALRYWAVNWIAEAPTVGSETLEKLAPLLEDRDPGVRYGAAAILARARAAAKPHAAALRAALGDSDVRIRVLVMSSIVACTPEVVPEVLESFVEALASTDASVREGGAKALGLAGVAAQPHAAVVAEALNDSEFEVRLAATRALANIGRTAVRAAGPVLGKLALTDHDPEVRRAAKAALREYRLGPRFGLPPD